jgi:glycosyltransferase involved in cell wall biosynthesis
MGKGLAIGKYEGFRPRKIDLVVHGRFDCFDLARALIHLGHDVHIYTNYPKFAAKRFGLPSNRINSFLRHGIMTRIKEHLDPKKRSFNLEPYFHRCFGSWAARCVRPTADLIYVYSGVGDEILHLSRETHPAQRWIVRGSAHIRAQHRLLCEEEARIGVAIDKPSAWMIAREEREYALADKIVVLSSFAWNSFVAEGVSTNRLLLLPLGVESSRFRASAELINERYRRILRGDPLEVLTVGSFTGQKGGLDLLNIAMAMAPRAGFTFVGDFSGELNSCRKSVNGAIEFRARVPQFELPRIYAAADLFLFPTIQDGFAAVLAQAAAAGVPTLTTTNCSGPDIIREGLTGWVLPIRRPDAFIERLQWCDNHRPELAAMVQNAHEAFRPRDWSDMATELVDAFGADNCSVTNILSG